ncbi:hypothetical protein HGA11_07160 [Mycolicibacterium septicum DSM 44393]|uniref:Pyruvate phosphate dikinase AMP/ATP-binding domain-containing protein n=1 Tax=Mycolicibacterium septicum DSM 44393 TaxID=1341646 RepID=A0A7X6MMS5_9MYCO|nr:hypothetical protein [Mycolicibacterium septicum]NKZ10756.1 hypothetical protein [Mycolicibacterium septicum DSM 44393]
MTASQPLKDDVLAELAKNYNVAQFISFGPGDAAVRHHELRTPLQTGKSLEDALSFLLHLSASGTINIRSFSVRQQSGNPFHYGIASASCAASIIRELAGAGFFTIANETIDVNDGGVSGVAAGGIVEFAPGDTPRAVEKPGIARLPIEIGFDVLQTIYRFPIAFGDLMDTRLEFSLHPMRCGTRREHAIVWESSEFVAGQLQSPISWPNRFSRFLGDKAFGLIVADALGHPVPYATVVARNVAPFSFGARTESGEWWTRTAPPEPVPGKYTTTHGWVDPFDLLQREDESGRRLASVLAQEGVDSQFSGATRPGEGEAPDVVEGVAGRGDEFMLGHDVPTTLPQRVVEDVRNVTADLRKQLGPVRIEWAHDGTKVWVLQMHRADVPSEHRLNMTAGVEPDSWVTYETASGLEALRDLLDVAFDAKQGIEVIGEFGLTSHVGELLAKAAVPVRVRDSGVGVDHL